MSFLRMILLRICISVSMFCYTGLALAEQSNDKRVEKIVLVCVNQCEDINLSPMRLRKLFLGIPVKVGNHYLKPLVNLSDDQLEHVFYQSIVAMSRKSYQAKNLMQKLRFALSAPLKFDDFSTLLIQLQRQPHSISYMWLHDAEQISNVSIIKTLWQGSYAEK